MGADYTLIIKLDDSELDKQLKKIQDTFGKMFGGSQGGGGNAFSGVEHLDKMFKEMDKISKIIVRQAPLKERVFKKLDALLSAGTLFPPQPTVPDSGGYDLETQGWVGGKVGGEAETVVEESPEEEIKEMTRQEKLMSGFEKLRDALGKIDNKQMALTGISFGIGALVGLFTDASEVLKATLGMLTRGIMLMLKPIGDFIGMMFRPMMVIFYQNVIGPWYRVLYPLMLRFFQSETWEGAMENWDSNIEGGKDIIKTIADHINGIESPEEIADKAGKFDDIPGFIAGRTNKTPAEMLGDWFAGASESLTKWWNEGWVGVSDWFGGIGAAVTTWWDEGWAGVDDWFTNVGMAVTKWWDDGWASAGDWFTGVGEAVTKWWNEGWAEVGNWWDGVVETVGASWQGFIDFFVNVGATISDIVSVAWQSAVDWFSGLIEGISMIGEGWGKLMDWFIGIKTDIVDTLTSTWDSIVATFEGVATTFKDAWDTVQGILDFIKSLNPFDDGGDGDGGGNVSQATAQARQDAYHGRTRRMAGGGIITEPIFGMGLNSGRQYLMGEGGPEQVTPMSTQRQEKPARNIVINATVMNNTQMDQLIQRVKQEIHLDDRRLGQI